MVESVELVPGDHGPVVSRTQGHAGRQTGRGAMAPLWRSMLSKSSPLYRNSLFSFSLWESRVQERELVLLRAQVERDRRALQHHMEKLSKELQQKDKLIESLRSKLEEQQKRRRRADSSTSRNPISGDAEHLERASVLMDDQGSTHEDLDFCSELDTVSEFGQEEVAEGPLQLAPSHPHPSDPSSSVASSHHLQSSTTCPSMPCTSHGLMDGQIPTELSSAPLSQSPQCLSAQMAFPPFDPHTQHPRPCSSPTGGFCLADVHQELQRLQRQLANSFRGAQVKPTAGVFHQSDRSNFHFPSQHAFQLSPFASLHASPNVPHGAQHERESAYNDVSSSSSGYHSGARHTGANLMEEHLREIRSLHRHLEDSIQTNECLRRQLAERLGSKMQDGGAPTNIYIQGLDSVSQLSNEVRVLKEENQALQSQLQQASRDGMKQVEQLRDAVLLEHTRLKQAELEAEKWAEQLGHLQAQMREQTQAVLRLKQDKQTNQENANRLQHEVNVLQQQLSESRRLVNALQCELQMYQGLRCTTEGPEEKELPSRMDMLEQQLSARLDPDVIHLSAKKRLFRDSPRSPPVRDTGFTRLYSASPISAQLQSSVTGCHEGQVPDGSFACRTGRHVVGQWDDFSALQQHLLEGKVLICEMEAALQCTMEINLHEDCPSDILTITKTLKQILEKTCSVVKMFWRAALPNPETTPPLHEKEQTLREEVFSLRQKLSEQDQTLRDALETLRNSNDTKDNMEQFILSQLSRTRDVLKKARTNLEVRSQSLDAAPILDWVS